MPLRLKISGKKASGRAVHSVGDVTKFCFAKAVPIDKFFDGVDVRCARVE